MDLNPDYRGFKSHPSGERIYEGDELIIKKGDSKKSKQTDEDAQRKDNMKEQWNTMKTDYKDFKEDVRSVITGRLDLKDTGLGQFLGKGKPFTETKVGELLGGGQPFEETGLGRGIYKMLGEGKPFEETGVGRTLGLNTPFPQTDFYQGFVRPLRSSKTSANPLFNKDLGELNPEAIANLVSSKRGGGLIQKYDAGGWLTDIFSSDMFSGDPSKFGNTDFGKWLGSDKGQEGMGDFSAFLQNMQKKGAEDYAGMDEYQAHKAQLEDAAEGPTGKDTLGTVVDVAKIGGKAASGNIPGAALDTAKLIFTSVKKKKARKEAGKQLDELEEMEEYNPMQEDVLDQYQQSLLQEDVASRDAALKNYYSWMNDEKEVPVGSGITFAKKGGIINSNVLPFLSDSYKKYLSQQYGGSTKRRRGGMVRGPSHEKGGVKYNVGGQVVELEGGEAVINKESTDMFRPILSKLNQAGGGVSFARGGLVNAGANKMINRLMYKNI